MLKQKRKKLISCVLAMGILFSGLPMTTASAAEFTDIQGHWAYDSIKRLTDRGIFYGETATLFAPNDTVTRGMYVTILARYDGYDPTAYTGSKFQDVPANSWYGPAVAWAVQKGIVSGVSSTTFEPDRPITREELAVITVNYANYAWKVLPRTRNGKLFSDSNACAGYALDAVYTLYRAGIINGTTDGRFNPKGSATRAECAVILSAYMDTWTRNYLGSEKVPLISHRGYNVTAPENTLPAYQAAADMGYTFVETDIRFTKDGVPVLLHDSTINRTSNGKGAVSGMTYQTLLQYDFGSWKAADYAGTRIATFAQFISLCRDRGLHPYLELKTSISAVQARQLVQIVSDYGMQDNVTWISYYTNALSQIRSADKTALLGILTDDITTSVIRKAINLKNSMNYVLISVDNTALTADKRAACLRNGVDFGVWNIDDIAEGVRAANTSTQYVTTSGLTWNILYGAG
ncbi:MAG: S-layer homology domain-containing protein [Eubacteriales bacterium]|nr:S-layer homology domain-containing protein [Eubacteriales bacterium]